ncbi:MAG: LacI family DNA-binding transcriptional regulator [Candidatus Brocadiia bacterium]
MSAQRRMPTMQEIADELGLSRLTISTVINDKARERGISEKTEDRVRKYLESIGYVPSRGARNLRYGGDLGVTGLLFSGHLYSHLTDAFLKLSGELSDPQSGWLETMLLPPQKQKEGLREMLARRVSHLVWLHADADTYEIRNPNGIIPLLRRFEHVVVYNYRYGFGQYEERLLDAGLDLVGVDREGTFLQLANRLRQLQHRRIGIWFPGAGEKIAASMRSQGLDVLVFGKTDFDYARMGEMIAEWVVSQNLEPEGRAGNDRLSAICVGNDQVAGHLMTNLIKQGIRIPEDVSVVGWSGEQVASALKVPLATLRVPVETMKNQTLRLLDEEGAENGERYCYKGELVERKSLKARGNA